jgi:hypothetical protein
MADMPRSIGVPAMTGHGRDPDSSGQAARATSRRGERSLALLVTARWPCHSPRVTYSQEQCLMPSGEWLEKKKNHGEMRTTAHFHDQPGRPHSPASPIDSFR